MGPAELADDFGELVELPDDGGSDASRKDGTVFLSGLYGMLCFLHFE